MIERPVFSFFLFLCVCVCVCAHCRCNLAGVMLQLMALGIPDVMNFDFMSKPSPGKNLFFARVSMRIWSSQGVAQSE